MSLRVGFVCFWAVFRFCIHYGKYSNNRNAFKLSSCYSALIGSYHMTGFMLNEFISNRDQAIDTGGIINMNWIHGL